VNIRRRVGDRRLRPRFEVVGDLWGTLGVVEPLPIVNISAGGALIECERAWPIGAVHTVLVGNGRDVGRAEICVRRVSPAGQDAVGRFHAGVEFLSVSPALADEIARWAGLDGGALLES
jgi:hypothetical protein